MTNVDTRPAQAAKAGAQGRAPASPRHAPSSSQPGAATEREAPAGQGPRNTEPGSRAPSERGTTKMCGAKNRQGRPCGNGRGKGTDHPGVGRCKHHGGSTRAGTKAASREAAARALERLGQPVGSGSPLQLLEKAVRYADGNLEASAALLVEVVQEQPPEKVDSLLIDAARELFTQAIRLAGRVGKEAADAHIAERRASIDEMIVGLLERVLLAGLDELGVSSDQREAALARMHRELVAVLPDASELN